MTGAIDYLPVQQRIAALMSHAQGSYHKEGAAATPTVNTNNNNNNNNSIPAEKIPRSVSSQSQNEASEPTSPSSSTSGASNSAAPTYVRSWGAFSQYRKKSSAGNGYQFQGLNNASTPSTAPAPVAAPLPEKRERRASRSGSFSQEPAQPLAQPSPFHGINKYVPVATNPSCFACHKTGMFILKIIIIIIILVFYEALFSNIISSITNNSVHHRTIRS